MSLNPRFAQAMSGKAAVIVDLLDGGQRGRFLVVRRK
jgi:hypothetical protein